jgi:succinyl-CoA:acetate CoA-transferase
MNKGEKEIVYEDRILNADLRKKVVSVQEAAALIKSGMTFATSGFAAGYPKALPQELAAHSTATNVRMLSAVSNSESMDGVLARSDVLGFHGVFQDSKAMRQAINAGKIGFCDCHLGMLADKVRNGDYGKIDYLVFEALYVDADGSLAPVVAAGLDDVFLEAADKVIVEINVNYPVILDGFCDFGRDMEKLTSPAVRIGSSHVPCPPEKIAAIFFTDVTPDMANYRPVDAVYKAIGNNIVEVINSEISAGRLEKNFTFQSGVGGVANAVLTGLIQSGFKDLRMYTELMTDIAIQSILDGTISEATTTGISVEGDTYASFLENLDYYKRHLVVRPVDVTNNGELIRRMGLVSMNTIVEGDIYGNVNSSHAMGSHIINGVGGSNDFARHAKLAIFQTPSTARGGAISSIVPMVSHVDNTEHDVDILVTEQGWADLRGKTPRERAELIIENCAHPDYRPALRAYYEEALALCGPCQTPHNLEKALSWHTRFLKTGSMIEKKLN